MKTAITLKNWFVKQADGSPLPAQLAEPADEKNGWLDAGRGLQVQEVLLNHGMLDRKVLLGHTEDAQWIADEDWIYRCSFTADTPERPAYLLFRGVDTIADYYLNGEMLGSSEDMFVPVRLDVSGKLNRDNTLAVYFHSPNRVVNERLAQLPVPEEERTRFDKISVIRKCCLDFGDFGKVRLTTVGLFEDVELCFPDECEIAFADIETTLNDRYSTAQTTVTLSLAGRTSGQTSAKFVLYAPDGAIAAKAAASVSTETQTAQGVLTVQAPQLWWPKNYGSQPLYRLEITLWAGERMLDRSERTLGIRNLQKTGDMRFRVNGREIKLWGGNMVPLYGFTHRWDTVRCAQVMERIDLSGMNCLRLWGGGMPFGDSFYETCDKLGVMIYQDLYLNWAYYPETETFRRLYRMEAEYQIKRLKHHPCILLWSGGNETYMHNEEIAYRRYDFGYKPFKEDFAQAAAKYDPHRFYLTSSPSGGDYPSDPSEGDGHPLYYTYRHSVEKYPVFASESARTSTGPLRSLERFMGRDEIWPQGYVNQVTYPDTLENRRRYFSAQEKFFVPYWKKVPIPDTWQKWSADFFAGESAAVEKFYEAHDAESLVYRYNAAYTDFMKNYSEGVRRGKPHYDLTGRRRSNGYLLWKINDTWPQFYCSLFDYFLEPYIPFYQVRRSFSPVLLSYEVDDHMLLWGVNDTAQDVQGTLVVRGFSMANNKVMAEMSLPVSLRAGESKVLTDLDPISPIIREWALFAELRDSAGAQTARSDTFMEEERYLVFPEAKIMMKMENGELVLSTDRFAHCVELTGNEDGDEFGWLFEDNYFNLFPFETKRVRILGSHRRGTVRARAHYSEGCTELTF